MKARNKHSGNILDKLNSFLDASSPYAAKIVRNLYKNQQDAITFREIREAIVRGDMTTAQYREWQNDYSRFVTNELEPIWKDAMKKSAENFQSSNSFSFDLSHRNVVSWIEENGARWVTNQSEESKRAMRAMLGYASTGEYSVDELAKVIRPTIGLTEAQSKANARYYTHVKERLKKSNPTMRPATVERRAREAAAKYSERQIRYRADTIAQTELAYAYNRGYDETIHQAMEQGLMGRMARRWITARDSDVCPICADMDGVIVDMDSEFDLPTKSIFRGAHQTPPAHPRCRCALEYIELEPPKEERIINPQAPNNMPDIIDGNINDIPSANSAQTLDIDGTGGIIKPITVDDVDDAVSGKDIDPAVTEIIKKYFVKNDSKQYYINEITVESIPKTESGTPVMQTVAWKQAGVYSTTLILNKTYLAGKSIKDIDKGLKNSDKNVAQNFEEAVIHEIGHAKTIYANRKRNLEALYEALMKMGVIGISQIALEDGAEAVAEIEVLLSRGEYVPPEAMELYEAVMKGEIKL